MSDHVRELLLLRDGSADGELLYRKQVMRLLGAEPIEGLTGVDMVRRAEGRIAISDGLEDQLDGLVVFAVGDDGRGTLSDVRSKSGQPSAGGLLVARGVDFVILVTTNEPSEALLEAAEAKSELFWLGGSLRRRIWVMGVPEVVERGEVFLEERGAVPAKKGLWGWFSNLVSSPKEDVPLSPLLVKFPNDELEELERKLEKAPPELGDRPAE
jgi:hypothetical protein